MITVLQRGGPANDYNVLLFWREYTRNQIKLQAVIGLAPHGQQTVVKLSETLTLTLAVTSTIFRRHLHQQDSHQSSLQSIS